MEISVFKRGSQSEFCRESSTGGNCGGCYGRLLSYENFIELFKDINKHK